MRGVVRCLAVTAASAISLSVVGATVSAARPSVQPRRSQPTELDLTKDLKNRYGEPQIAANPKNPKNLVYAALTMGLTYACQHAKRPECQAVDTAFAPQPKGLIDNKPGFSHVSVFMSFDLGKTWKKSGDVPAFPPGHSALVERGDPLLTVGPDGTFYLGWDDIRFGNLDGTIIAAGGIAVSKSTNGGRTWSKPVLTGTPVDRPFFAVDDSTGMIYEASTGQLGSPSKGDAKLLPIPITAPGDRWLVASRDGVHWTEPQAFGGVGAFPPGTFGAAAGGMFATAFKTSNADLCAGPPQCTVFQTTTDGGATWSRHVVSLPSDTSGAPLVAADPQAPGRFTIAVLTGGQAQFSVYQTQDAGNTWSGPTTITDDPTKTHFHPWMAYSPKGVLGLMWQTNVSSAPAPAGGGLPAALSESVLEALPEPVREGVEAQTAGPPSPYNVWAATSGDEGATFSEPLKISKAESPAPQPFLPYGIGDDFSFIALSGTHAFVGWADYRPGDRQGFFSAVDLDAFARNGTSG